LLRVLAAVLMVLVPLGVHAETGAGAWLRYAQLDGTALARMRQSVPPRLITAGPGQLLDTARQEIVRGIRGLLGRDLPIAVGPTPDGAIVLATLDQIRRTMPQFDPGVLYGADAYRVRAMRVGGARYIVVAAESESGVLYGTFALLRRIAFADPIVDLNETSSPYAGVRWVNQWDNLDGTIERGYGGRSIFWDAGRARPDLTRVAAYGRLLASVGINGISINNVNANPQVLSAAMIPDVARIAAALRPWGVRVALAIDFGSPQSVGKLPTYDPVDPAVIAWWKGRVDEIYQAVPDFAGFVLKADSEGRVGPSTYGRTHADAANVVARALAPHGGLIFYRGFVYDHHMDWQNPKNDRARAAYDNFHPLDGKFDSNVIVQIKNGPIDFQVREPASPLFGALPHTNEAIELQITQEYMGQGRHTVFLVPMWKETLDFNMGGAKPMLVKAIVAGKITGRLSGGLVGVANIGLDENWSGNHLSQANLYGFGRLAWDPDLSARQIIDEWTRMTFGNDRLVGKTIADLQLSSWQTYENYTGPLGLQTLTDIVGNHYGVAVEASERNGWGQWHFADERGVGMERSVAKGTGFIGQYQPAVAKLYETASTCPDDLLLFMHHVPYTHRLHSGKTVIQHLYDSHYEGADAVQGYVRQWSALKGLIDDQRYAEVLAQLEYQAGQAVVWRDAVSNWFLRASKIPDAQGRVGHYPNRIEAESAVLTGYVPRPVTPWEAASGGQAVECGAATCVLSFKYSGAAGPRDLLVRYFDTNTGSSHFTVSVGGRTVGEWVASDRRLVRNERVDGSSSSLRVIPGVVLNAGDEIRIEGVPDGPERAALDYVEIR
jgi:alpha-glucuronidase